MKQRYSSLDVKVIAHELSESLITLRLANIHDLSSKIFLFKFQKPGDKKQLILDAGFRCHLTAFSRTTAASPSPFVMRLRKYLQSRRTTSVAQIGTDRIIEFQFSDGLYRLFFEFYAGGNIVLTDRELNILALQRIVSEGEGQEELRIGLKYVLENKQNYHGVPPVTKERLIAALQKAVDAEKAPAAARKIKKKGGDALRKALAVSVPEYPPILIDHALYSLNFPSTLKPSEVLENEERLEELILVLGEAQKVVDETMSSSTAKGYIIAKRGPATTDASTQPPLVYDDFHPYKPKQFEADPNLSILEFEGYNKTVDEFFSSIEGQKLESHVHERELAAKRRLEAARADQQRRIGDLESIQQRNERKAAAIEANVERVQEAMDAVNGLVAQGMDWVEIEKLVEMEQKRQNPVAQTIKLPLKLHENTITLLLGEQDLAEDDDIDDETDSEASDSESEERRPAKKPIESRLAIDISLGLTPWSNAGEYYSQKRSAADKQQKTLESSSKALKGTEQKIEQALKKALGKEKPTLRPVRQPLWFEKFIWFISSDGYLVLGGRDPQQNETLYRKFLRKGDVYCHADLPGAASIVIRNNSSTPDAPIPPSTLSQAGTLAVSTSNAWDSKAVMSAWWVNAEQVSKSAPTGGFLPTGTFTVQGKKNFLPPSQLLLGFGVLFKISDQSKAKHLKHRVVDGISPDSASEKVITDEQDQQDEPSNNEPEEDVGESSDDETQETNPRHENPLQPSALVDGPGHEDSGLPLSEKATEDTVTGVQDLNISKDADEDEPAAADEEFEEGQSPSNGSDDRPDIPEMEAQKSGSTMKTANGANSQKGPAPAKRGQRGKAKKIANKYKDQDEEDRQAAQQLIGATVGQERARAEAQAKLEREAQQALQKERRRAQHQRDLEEVAKHEEKRKQMMDEGIDLDDDAAVTSTVLDVFVGTPLPGDEILEAIPMCAPWSAMTKTKYKAKLQPGPQKKGKAVKEILGRWQAAMSGGKVKMDMQSQDRERIWPVEAELIKAWKAEEIINTVPVSKVRVMMAGGTDGASAPKGAPGRSKGGKGGKKR